MEITEKNEVKKNNEKRLEIGRTMTKLVKSTQISSDNVKTLPNKTEIWLFPTGKRP
ncbi:MAG: hypothetical protein REV36_01710 [Burkholderia sp.]|nr:hypothetical protein [Burkholderia sp.]